MAKPKPRRIESSGCVVAIGGEPVRVHEGEYVSMAGGPSVGELGVLFEVQRYQTGESAAMAPAEVAARMESWGATLSDHLAHRVFEWTWTDDTGQPLPQPCEGGLKCLRLEELLYLVGASEAATVQAAASPPKGE